MMEPGSTGKGLLHTFLQREGTWLARGTYTDLQGKRSRFEGRAEISHSRETWINRSWMELEGRPPVRIENDYEIRPFGPGELQTTWQSENQAIGRLKGRFTLVGDAIISDFATDDGLYCGFEFLLLQADGSYLNRGVFFKGARLFSIWEAVLARSG